MKSEERPEERQTHRRTTISKHIKTRSQIQIHLLIQFRPIKFLALPFKACHQDQKEKDDAVASAESKKNDFLSSFFCALGFWSVVGRLVYFIILTGR